MNSLPAEVVNLRQKTEDPKKEWGEKISRVN